MLLDIVEYVRRNFEEPDRSVVATVLESYAGPEPDRVRRCVLHLANGNAGEVKNLIEAATVDYRDVILWAEYDSGDRQLRDCSRPFEPD
jgi:hypothetical protein